MMKSQSIRLAIASILLTTGVIFWSCGSDDIDDNANFDIGENQNQSSEEGDDFEWAVGPEPLVFSADLAPGDSAEQTVSVENTGEATLDISSVSIVDDDYEVFDEGDGWPGDEALAPGETFEFSVQYAPEFVTAYEAELVIDTNDPDRESEVVDIVAQAPETNLSVSPTEMEFPEIPAETTDEKVLTIENTGSDVLQIVDIMITAGEEAFDLTFVDPDTGEEAMTPPEFIAPDDDPVEVVVYFNPDDVDEFYGTLSIYSNDPTHPEFEVYLSGSASPPCGLFLDARAMARAGDGGWTDDDISVEAGTIIELDAGNSEGPDGQQISYEWTLLNSPEPSNATIEAPTAETTAIYPQVVGNYVVELRVYDEDGRVSCEPAYVHIDAFTDSDIYVELTWKVPAADDGTGTDLDLHYLHPDGQWAAEPWGVYWANSAPNWQDQSQVLLAFDDLTGENPEVLIHNSPQPEQSYAVGVYYFRDPAGYGTTEGRVRIFLSGALASDSTQTFENAGSGVGSDTTDGDFWNVADITPTANDSTDLDAVDEFYESSGFPE